MIDTILYGDALKRLKDIPDGFVNCCVTSPPYWGLRDYGVDGQFGLESTPAEYIKKFTAIFSEVRRVLIDDGTLWLNLGDTYNGYLGNSHRGQKHSGLNSNSRIRRDKGCGISDPTLKPKDLVGVPWMAAFALRNDGWYLRQDIIWHKPNPMPESVTDRCTKSHEYIFLMSKSRKYYYDYDNIKTPIKDTSKNRYSQDIDSQKGSIRVPGKVNGNMKTVGGAEGMANKKSVWTVSTRGFKEAHFATFPPDLIVDCIKAGCPEGGIVLDPFMGAGTTAVVAKKLGRHYLGIELNSKYIEISNKRIHDEVGLFK